VEDCSAVRNYLNLTGVEKAVKKVEKKEEKFYKWLNKQLESCNDEFVQKKLSGLQNFQSFINLYKEGHMLMQNLLPLLQSDATNKTKVLMRSFVIGKAYVLISKVCGFDLFCNY
jgi:hypothetical protein